MKKEVILYRVYTKKGEYHHGYSAKLEGSRNWAIDCAKTIRGRVAEVYDDIDGPEEAIFDYNKKVKK